MSRREFNSWSQHKVVRLKILAEPSVGQNTEINALSGSSKKTGITFSNTNDNNIVKTQSINNYLQ